VNPSTRLLLAPQPIAYCTHDAGAVGGRLVVVLARLAEGGAGVGADGAGFSGGHGVSVCVGSSTRRVTILQKIQGATMEEKLWKVIGFWAMGLILFIATFIIIRWAINFATWSALDAGWAQAIGAIASIWGAFWIANRSAREQRARERTLAIVASVAMTHKIAIIKVEIGKLAVKLGKAPVLDFSPAEFDSAIDFLSGLPAWSTEEISVLMPLSDDCAQNLAAAQGRIQFVAAFMDRAIKRTPPVSDRKRRIRVASMCKDRLDQAGEKLDAALQVMKRSQKRNAL